MYCDNIYIQYNSTFIMIWSWWPSSSFHQASKVENKDEEEDLWLKYVYGKAMN